MKSVERTGGRIALLTLVGTVSACSIPTDTPRLEQEWILPITETSVNVVEFLPDKVELTGDSSAFTIRVAPVSFNETLGVLCDACKGLDGLTVPKPAFVGDFNETVPLPDGVESAQVHEGRIAVAARNGFGFDPLRPPGGGTGTLTLALRDGGPEGDVLDQVVIHGDDTSFGQGTTITRKLEYSGPVGSSISVTVSVNSPAGGPQPGNWVPIRLNDQLRITATSEVLEAESADIAVAGEIFDLGITSLDVADISGEMVNKLRTGYFRFELVNPWSVPGILSLTINGPTMAAPVILIGQIPPTPTSVVEVEVSRADLQSFLGEPGVVMSGQGTADQNAGIINVAPGQLMTIKTRLDLVIQIG